MNDKEEKLYDLLTSKSFGELSKDEQAFVLSSLGSEKAYAKMSEANLAAKEALAEDEEVPSSLKSSVMEAYDKKEDKKRGIVWWKYAAAVAILILGGYVFWPAGNPEKVQLAENKPAKKEQKEEATKQDKIEQETAEMTEVEESGVTLNEEDKTESKNNIPPDTKTKFEGESVIEIEHDFEEVEPNTIAEDIEMLADEEVDEDLAEAEVQVESMHVQKNGDESEVLDFNEITATENTSKNRVTSMDAAPATARSSTSLILDQNTGVLLSSIGGPFPKSYVAY